MRRAHALLIVPLLAAAAIAGCSSSSSSSSSSTGGSSTGSAAASQSVTVSGSFGASPKVQIPKAKAGSDLYTRTLIQGTGQTLTSKDSLVGNFVLYVWSGTTAKMLGSTYSKGSAPTLLTGGQTIKGLETALVGQKVGSRVLAVIPPKDGFGTTGNSSVGITGSDTLVFVVDMVKAYAGTSGVSGTATFNGGSSLPTVTAAAGKPAVIKIPAAKAPKTLTVKTLTTGSGTKIKDGDLAVLQYTGAVWKAGTPAPFDSSWSRSQPFGVTVGAGQVITGWDKGLVGQTAGSRVMLVIPPAEGYGSTAQGKIPANSTLVFVVDIVAVYGAAK